LEQQVLELLTLKEDAEGLRLTAEREFEARMRLLTVSEARARMENEDLKNELNRQTILRTSSSDEPLLFNKEDMTELLGQLKSEIHGRNASEARLAALRSEVEVGRRVGEEEKARLRENVDGLVVALRKERTARVRLETNKMMQGVGNGRAGNGAS
jgi:hypothetical protein